MMNLAEAAIIQELLDSVLGSILGSVEKSVPNGISNGALNVLTLLRRIIPDKRRRL